MSLESDTRDRVIRLETQVQHLSHQLEDTHEKVDQMHQLLLQAKGVRWAVLAFASFGGFVAALLVNFTKAMLWMSPLPK